jgi:transposase InsO family protein
VKYACIQQHRRDFPVTLMCRVLHVSASGFYAAQQRPARGPSAHAARDATLRRRVHAAYAASGRTYGAPRVHAELRAAGERVARKRVARLMRADGLAATRKRRRVRTTDSGHAAPIAPNRLARRFAPTQVAGPNRVWVSDITYVPTGEGWLYLAIVLDLASRRVVGWAMRPTLETPLALAALQMALTERRPAPGLVHHSDRGVQYAAAPYQALLATHGLVPSMSRRGDCWDNAVAESFFATLEFELLAQHRLVTRAEAQRAIFAYVATWYNPRRRHSTLGYRSPAEYERALTAA